MKPLAVPFALVLSSLLAVPAGAAPSDTSSYHVVQRFTPGGEGGWDYLTLDPAARRLYVARATRVQVLDAATGRRIGEIAGTPGVHGIALAPGLGRGYTSNGRDSSVTVFDLQSLTTLTTIPVGGRNPDAILFEPVTKRGFTFNGGTHDATAIDAPPSRIRTRVHRWSPEASSSWCSGAEPRPGPKTSLSLGNPRAGGAPGRFPSNRLAFSVGFADTAPVFGCLWMCRARSDSARDFSGGFLLLGHSHGSKHRSWRPDAAAA